MAYHTQTPLLQDLFLHLYNLYTHLLLFKCPCFYISSSIHVSCNGGISLSDKLRPPWPVRKWSLCFLLFYRTNGSLLCDPISPKMKYRYVLQKQPKATGVSLIVRNPDVSSSYLLLRLRCTCKSRSTQTDIDFVSQFPSCTANMKWVSVARVNLADLTPFCT